MTCRKLAILFPILAMPASIQAHGGTGAAAANHLMVASYWGYVAFLPLIVVAFVVHGWLIRPKG